MAQAEDIFQDTFINFLKAIENNNNIDNVQGYLLKIARNNSINHKKTVSSNIIFEELIEDFHSSNQDEKYESKEIIEIVNRALDLLPDEFKEAFVLQVYEGMSYQEIANLTNVPVTTVRNRVVRAKMKMRDILAPIFNENIN